MRFRRGAAVRHAPPAQSISKLVVPLLDGQPVCLTLQLCYFDFSWICCTTRCTANPRQIEGVRGLVLRATVDNILAHVISGHAGGLRNSLVARVREVCRCVEVVA